MEEAIGALPQNPICLLTFSTHKHRPLAFFQRACVVLINSACGVARGLLRAAELVDFYIKGIYPGCHDLRIEMIPGLV